MRDAQPISLEALDRYFDILVAATTNKKSVLEDLVANFTTLTISNAEMVNTIKKISGKNR